MQAELRCVRKYFLWSSIEGVFGDEDGQSDAFAAILEVLRARLQPAAKWDTVRQTEAEPAKRRHKQNGRVKERK